MKHLEIEKAEIFTDPEDGKVLRVVYWKNRSDSSQTQPLRHTSFFTVYGEPAFR